MEKSSSNCQYHVIILFYSKNERDNENDHNTAVSVHWLIIMTSYFFHQLLNTKQFFNL